MRYHYTPIRRAKIKRLIIQSIGENMEGLKLSYTGGENTKGYCHYEKQFGGFLPS